MSEPADEYDPMWELRVLYHDVLAYEGKDLYFGLLAPWLEKNGAAREWLLSFAQRRGEPIPPAQEWEIHALYAVNRVNDLLLGGFQPATVSEWPNLPITLDEYVAFMTGLGFEVVDVTAYSPFYHEVMEVAQSDEDAAPVELVSIVWPCLMLGCMLFSRAGVKVRSGRKRLSPVLAGSSTLYWAFCRRYRPCEDLSHGWGSNSQWRTEFRRDYRFGSQMYLNVDRAWDVSLGDKPGYSPSGLSLEERTELVIHRCFVTRSASNEDPFPYVLSLNLTERE
ncbi:hypothetical protein [Prosthecobacter vanneervenii]|uniref:Uncharacterized protein n=1 Tax=Prosthecobacter vanneervenii TaxID=48466 RepID=A0A7W8DJH5_9BACT|nr:hypothetical protein [Prosthecobacter vanneervenii]MBB5031851.1 hypothetical protein [Prosthecobacter vanneervenii]